MYALLQLTLADMLTHMIELDPSEAFKIVGPRYVCTMRMLAQRISRYALLLCTMHTMYVQGKLSEIDHRSVPHARCTQQWTAMDAAVGERPR